MNPSKSNILQTFLLIFILLILPFATSSQINNTNPEQNPQENQINTFQSSYLCIPSKLINITEKYNSLLHCFSYTIFGINNESDTSWLDEGVSLHLIFYNESYDLGIRNSTYEEYIKVSDWIEENLELNETYYYDSRDLVAKKDNNGEISYYHPDHLGSTSLITNSTGGIVSNLNYEPFGKLTQSSDERYTFTGHENDQESQLLYMKSRYYNPYTTKFTQPDSIIKDTYDPQNLNRYSYVLNNPYKYIDVNGKWALQVGIGGSVGIAPAYLSGSTGIAIAYDSNKDLFDVGIYGSGSGLTQEGIGLKVTLDIAYTPEAMRISDLKGSSEIFGASGAYYYGGGYDYSTAKESSLITHTGHLGAGFAVETHVGESITFAYGSRDLSDISSNKFEDSQTNKENLIDKFINFFGNLFGGENVK